MKTKEKRNHTVDILKVYAIIMVIIAHYSFNDVQRLKYGFPFWLKMAVPIFMIISGYTLALSFEKNSRNTLAKSYERNYVLSRILKFCIPATIIIVTEIVYRYLFLGVQFDLAENILSFLSGGYGKGSYYNVLIIQLILIFPIVYYWIKKKKEVGLIHFFIINLLFEIFKTSFRMNVEFYRLIIFRYLFFIAAGCYIYTGDKKWNSKVIISSIVIGLVYIFMVSYGSFQPLFINYWSDTSLMVGLYIVPIIAIILKKVKMESANCLVTMIAKSTYHIYLFQMLFYYIIDTQRFHFMDSTLGNLSMIMIISLTGGILYYYIDNHLLIKIKEKLLGFKMNVDIRKYLINGKEENEDMSKWLNNKRLLFINIFLFIIIIVLFILRHMFNFDFIIAIIVLLMLLSLYLYKPSFFIKYFFAIFYCIYMLAGVFICNNSNLFLSELSKNSGYNGSFGLAVIYNVVFIGCILIFDNILSKKVKYYLPNNNFTKSKFVNKFFYILMFCFGGFLFLLVIKNPSFMLKIDRFNYKMKYLPAFAEKFQSIYQFFIPVLLLPLIVKNEKMDKKWVIRISLVLSPYLLYGFWVGNKFGLYLNVMCLIITPLIAIALKKNIRFSKKDNLLIDEAIEKEIGKNIIRSGAIIIAVFLIFLIPYYLFRNINVIQALTQRTAQQGQLFWATFGAEETGGSHLDELNDELLPLIESFNGKKISNNYGVYKIMKVTAPKSKIKFALENGFRYSAQGAEIAFYYSKYLGVIVHAALRGIVEALLVCLLIKCLFSYRLVSVIIVSRLFVYFHNVFTQGDLHMIFSKTTLFSIVVLIVFEIIYKKYVIDNKKVDKKINIIYNGIKNKLSKLRKDN